MSRQLASDISSSYRAAFIFDRGIVLNPACGHQTRLIDPCLGRDGHYYNDGAPVGHCMLGVECCDRIRGMAAHKACLDDGFEAGHVQTVGSLKPGIGGCILSILADETALLQYVEQDLFLPHNVVR